MTSSAIGRRPLGDSNTGSSTRIVAVRPAPRPPRGPANRRAGFTLVELLVVVGIIALLISILLPSLSSAREQAPTVACLSNLRQIGIIHTAYVNENRGYIVPCDYLDVNGGTTADGYKTLESWCTILVTSKYMPYPPNTTAGAVPNQDTILKCPSGGEEFLTATSISSGQPDSRKSGLGAMAVQHTSKFFDPGRVVYSWYGINGTSSDLAYMPTRRWPPDGKKPTDKFNPLPRITDVKKATDVVFLFDGMSINLQQQNANRLNARHGRQRYTNILFFDGHAETFPTKTLPGGDGNAGVGSSAASATFSTANLKNFPRPLWRTDQ